MLLNLKDVPLSYSVDWRAFVTQLKDPIFGGPSTSTYATSKVKDDEKVDNPPPDHVDYAKMLNDH
jgi:hypothetical protein